MLNPKNLFKCSPLLRLRWGGAKWKTDQILLKFNGRLLSSTRNAVMTHDTKDAL